MPSLTVLNLSTTRIKSLPKSLCKLMSLGKVEFLELFLGTSLSWKIGGLTEFKFVVGHDVKRFVSKVSDNLAFDNVPWDQCLRIVNG
ncbi:hypothetical protein CFP56_002808 [Quercus suber]|uniref:Uncharacterized protein n=1 Tax=Quercus suber TaxID=58331 RepID=A0AAW0IJ24_QUESU